MRRFWTRKAYSATRQRLKSSRAEGGMDSSSYGTRIPRLAVGGTHESSLMFAGTWVGGATKTCSLRRKSSSDGGARYLAAVSKRQTPRNGRRQTEDWQSEFVAPAELPRSNHVGANVYQSG